jgi:RNA recognition motif-containing protein
MRSSEFRANLFVANLPPDLTDEELAEAFDPFGIVLGAFIPRDPASGKALGYGFVDIATPRAQEAAIAGMNGAQLHGRRIEVKPSERGRGGKKPQRPAPQMSARGRPRRENEASRETVDGWPLMPPRKRPSFTVERRSLPRRF